MNNTQSKKIFISATEQSGDNIGSKILNQILKNKKSLVIDGIGGSKMLPYMNNNFYSIKDFKSMGLIEVIFSIFKYIKMINHISNIAISRNYDLIITIDSPDFNYPFAKKIKKLGYKGKLIQIVAPTVWAWRKNRAKKYSKLYDLILTLFNFENKYFEKFNLKTVCIGHPIYYINNNKINRKKNQYIAFLPGSRIGEIESLKKYFQLAYEYIVVNNIKYNIFIPTLPHLKEELISFTKKWKIKVIITTDEKTISNYYQKTKLALVCSGTASLEIAKRQIPQLIIYKLNFITELLVKNFVKVKFANIINIIANKMIIPELTNSNLNKSIFIEKFNNLIFNESENSNQINEVNKIIVKLERLQSPCKIASDYIQKLL